MLTNQEIQHFIEKGFVAKQSTVDARLHDEVFASSEALFSQLKPGFNPRNNILPLVPGLWEILEHPDFRSDIECLLGQDYLLHPHRHCHTNFPSRESLAGIQTETNYVPKMAQPLHKDGHTHLPKPRHHEPWWLIVFYFPQDTPMQRGPTAVLPGSHWLQRLRAQTGESVPDIRSNENHYQVGADFYEQQLELLSGKAGTYVLCHFDLGHGATVNASELSRYAMKFVFMRCQRTALADTQSRAASEPHYDHVWQFLGQPVETSPAWSLQRWKEAFYSDQPYQQITSSYAVAAMDDFRGIDDLLARLKQDCLKIDDWITALSPTANALALMSDPSPLLSLLDSDEPEMLAHGAYAAGQRGDGVAVKKMCELTRHPHPVVCRHALSALGLIGASEDTDRAISSLADVLAKSDDWDIRTFAIQALIRMGLCDSAIPVLGRSLYDSHPLVSAFAMEQLSRFDDSSAQMQVNLALRRQRWYHDERFNPAV